MLAVGALLVGCGGSASGNGTSAAASQVVKPTATYPGPDGLLAGGQPQANGDMWLLANSHGTANLQQLNLSTSKIDQIVPESTGANSLSQSSSGVIGVGVATATTGALELRNGSSGVLLATVPIGAPVKDVFAGYDGSTFYVLNGNSTSASVTLVDSQTDKPSVSVPVPLDTTAIAVDPPGVNLFALGSAGKVDEITIGSQTVAASYSVGSLPVALAISASGSTLYVLNNHSSVASVGVIDVATEHQTEALPAPANAVGVQVSVDGQSLYDIVGTSSYGNVQVFSITH
ncbi:MAG: hypothetical protein WB565_05965 [Acidimicrobiales bacterium]